MKPTRRTLIALAALALATPAFAQGMKAPAKAKTVGTVLVTGANRGIGLEIAKAYAAGGYKVIGTARKPAEATDLNALAKSNPTVTVEQLDVTSDAEIDALAAKYKGVAIDILVNNAGVTGDTNKQRFGSIDYTDFAAVMMTNVKGPLKISEAFIDNVAASGEKRIAVITSSEGSIAGVTSPRQPFYRGSKAAVNMVMRNVAFAVKDKGVIVTLVNPGPVDTDMMKGARGRMPLREVPTAAKDVIAVIAKTTMDKTGTFQSFDGTDLPW